MRRTRGLLISMILVSVFLAVQQSHVAQGAAFTLEVYDPSGATEITQLFAPRLADLNGKTICELSDGIWEDHRTFPLIRELLQRQFPTARIIPYTEFDVGRAEMESDANIALLVKKGCQAVITGNAG
jgi:hypothetical protein